MNIELPSPILSICIPTFNRSTLLNECLQSIIIAIEKKSTYINLVEIIISDNCSTDDTFIVANYFCQKYTFIRYYKNDKNVIDLNFYLAAERSIGKYVWIFGDDDVFLSNTFDIIFEHLYNDYSLIISNYSLWDFKLSKCLKESYLQRSKIKQIKDHNILMKLFGLRLAFISCIIIKRDSFLSFDKEIYTNNIHTGFPFLLTVYFSQINNCKAFFITDTLFIQRGNFKHASKEWWYKVFLIGSNSIFDMLKNYGYKDSAITSAKLKILNSDIKEDIIYRKVNNDNINFVFKNLLKIYYKYPKNLSIILIYLFTPPFLYRLIFRIKNG